MFFSVYVEYAVSLSFIALCCVLTAFSVFQKNSQLWKEVQLHQEEPQCPSGQEQLALQTGTGVNVKIMRCV